MECLNLLLFLRCSPRRPPPEEPPLPFLPQPSASDELGFEDLYSEESINENPEEAEPPPLEQEEVEAEADLETEELSSLLNQDDFLVKVFRHLVEDGLHECRRVCRKWRRICDGVTSKICFNRHAKNLESMHLHHSVADLKYTEEDMFEFFCPEEDRCAIRRNFLKEWPYLTSVSRLSVNTEKDWIFPEMDESRFAVLKGLESLNLTCAPYSVNVLEMLTALKQLTKLTALEIQSTCSTRGYREPLTSLTGIRDLRVPINLLVNAEGELLFPALTALTCLEIKQNRCTLESRIPIERRLLMVLGPYMESLITLRLLSWTPSLLGNLSLFSRFTGLASLKLPYAPEPQALFFDTLHDLRFLTELILMQSPYRDGTAMPESLVSLFKLRSLTFNHGHQSVKDLMQSLPLNQMTNLTELRAGIIRMPYNFGALTSLVKLEVKNLIDFYCCDLGDVYLSNAVLSNFRFLEELTLNCIAVDDDLFQMLATLTRLTNLGVLNLARGKEEMLFPQVNLVTNLRRLTLQSETSHNPVPYLKLGKLKNLREFRGLSKVIVREAELSQLHTGLPCIRRILRR